MSCTFWQINVVIDNFRAINRVLHVLESFQPNDYNRFA